MQSFLCCLPSYLSWSRQLHVTGDLNLLTGAEWKNSYIAMSILSPIIVPAERHKRESQWPSPGVLSER